jgi:ribosomal protein S18 acetylase RimI-like enzyme
MITYQHLLSTVDSDSPTGSCCIALCNGVLVGSLGLSLRNPVAHVNALFVHPDYQGQGIAKSLLLLAFSISRLQGKHLITLTVHQANTRAKQLYTGMGFSVCGTGNSPDYLLLQADLRPIT